MNLGMQFTEQLPTGAMRNFSLDVAQIVMLLEPRHKNDYCVQYNRDHFAFTIQERYDPPSFL